MALRFDASGEKASRTTNLPTASGFTLAGFFKIVTDRNAASTFLHYGATAAGNVGDKTLETGTDGTTLTLWDGADAVTGTNLTVGSWVHLALTYDAANARAYLNGVLDITNARVANPTASIAFGNTNTADNEWLNGCCAALKVYSAVLTAAEILQEASQILPVRLANLNSFFPCVDQTSANCLKDYSGISGDLTAAGTLSVDADMPPVPWKRGLGKVIYVVGSSAQNLTAGDQTVTITAPNVSLVLGAVALAAGANTVTITAPAATLTSGGVTQNLTAGDNVVTITAPAVGLTAIVNLAAGAQTVTVTAPAAVIQAIRNLLAGDQTVTITAPVAARTTGQSLLAAGIATVTFTAPIATLTGGAAPADVWWNALTGESSHHGGTIKELG